MQLRAKAFVCLHRVATQQGKRKKSVQWRAGLAPEYVLFTDAGMVPGSGARHNLLRPEAMEAAFLLWRVTGKQMYQEWAWAMFQAFERHSKARQLSHSRRVRGRVS